MQAGEEIGALALGEAEEELANLASLPVTPGLVRAFKFGWNCMFTHWAASVVYRREVEGADPVRIATKAFFREPLEKEMVEGVMVSDQSIIINPQPLIAAGLEWPPQQGDKIIKNKGAATETMFSSVTVPFVVELAGEALAVTVPFVVELAGEALAVRMIGRGV